jgi:hypothetical protein
MAPFFAVASLTWNKNLEARKIARMLILSIVRSPAAI